MKLICGHFLVLLFVVSSLLSCKPGPPTKRTDESYLNNDFKPDALYPAGQVELTIPSSGSKIYGLAYTADGKGPHPTVVLSHGLPGNERNLDLAQSIRRAGYNVIYYNYRGSWGSEGIFGFKNAIEDVKSVVDYITDPANMTALRVDQDRIVLYGHSMGASFSLFSGLTDLRVKGIIGTSVFNPFTLLQGDEARGNLLSLKEYLLSLGMLKCDPDKFLNDILDDLPGYNIEDLISRSEKPVLIIDEHMNNQEFTRFNKKEGFAYKIWNTDQAFSNRRIALTLEIKNWLDRTLPDTAESTD